MPARVAAAAPAPRLVLASASPRRRELLARAGFAFEVEPADIPEERAPEEAPEAFARRLAREKVLAVAARAPGAVVLGADTIVVLGGDVLGKPRDPEHAVALLSRLVGRAHVVVTAVAVCAGGVAREVAVASEVRMRDATRDEIRAYVATGEPLDKAGAYGLQGEGRRFVVAVAGSETNVIGLPVAETVALLRAAGVAPSAPAARDRGATADRA
ncbi:MAG: Maf family protein [Myxococcota bacterium]